MKKPYSKSKFALDGDRVPDPWFTFICEYQKVEVPSPGIEPGTSSLRSETFTAKLPVGWRSTGIGKPDVKEIIHIIIIFSWHKAVSTIEYYLWSQRII